MKAAQVDQVHLTTPRIYESSSAMSPDRRELYLSHKSGARTVSELDEETTKSITKDARFPLDLVCVHHDIGKIAFACYSSKMLKVAKIQPASDNTATAIKAIRQLSTITTATRLPEDILQRLPRKTGMRKADNYDRIPISDEGAVLVSEDYYPTFSSSKKTTQSLNTDRWYVWFSIVADFSNNRTTLVKCDSKVFFCLTNGYTLLGEQIV